VARLLATGDISCPTAIAALIKIISWFIKKKGRIVAFVVLLLKEQGNRVAPLIIAPTAKNNYEKQKIQKS